MYSLPRRSRLARRRFSLVCHSRDSFRKSRKVALAVHVASRHRAQSTQLNHIGLTMSRSQGAGFRIGATNLAQRWLRGQNFRWRGCRRGCREQFVYAADEMECGGLRRWYLRAATSSWSGAVPDRMHMCSPGRPKAHACVRCVLTQCVSFACALRVQRQRISTCCVNKHATGRAAVLQQPYQWLFALGNIFFYETMCERQRSSSCDRTLAPPRTAAALPMVHHLLTVVVARVF